MSLEYRFNQIINTYECTPVGYVNPIAPLNYFQEAAQRQLEERGIGVQFAQKRDYAWILVKYEIDYHKYPVAGEEVIIETRPTGINRFEAYRRFRILSLEGEELISAKSVWVLADINSGKLLRINEVGPINEALGDVEMEVLKVPRLKKIDTFDLEKDIDVRYLDIDVNNHVNNTRYIAWAVELLPLDVLEAYKIEKVTVYYKQQAFYGEKLQAKGIQTAPGIWRINIENEEGAVLCEIEIKGRRHGE